MRGSRSRLPVLAAVLVGVLLIGASQADAAALGAHHLELPMGSIFSSIGGALLGAFKWTLSLATKFILVTLSAFIRMLIPKSWARAPIDLFGWVVEIPDYAGTVTSPSGATAYGFAGINALRSLFTWIGLALLPITLTSASGRALIGRGDHPVAPVARVVLLGAGLLLYTWGWAQTAAVVDQVTHLILSPSAVTEGIRQLMAYATEGVALGGWQLIDLGLMGALAVQLLALIAVKVVVILLGALLYTTGPGMLGLVATDAGAVVARAWASAVATLFALPIVWATIFAVGAVLIGDASTAGPLIGGHTAVGTLLGGVIVAVTGAATLWLCLRAAKEAGGILRTQLGGMSSMARSGSRATSGPSTATTAGSGRAAQSVRSFQSRVRDASQAALVAGGPAGARTAAVGGGVLRIGRRGLVGSGYDGARGLNRLAHRGRGGPSSSGGSGSSDGGSRLGRAGAVASRMARAGTASWQTTRPTRAGTTASATSAARPGRLHRPQRPAQDEPRSTDRHTSKDRAKASTVARPTAAGRPPSPSDSASSRDEFGRRSSGRAEQQLASNPAPRSAERPAVPSNPHSAPAPTGNPPASPSRPRPDRPAPARPQPRQPSPPPRRRPEGPPPSGDAG